MLVPSTISIEELNMILKGIKKTNLKLTKKKDLKTAFKLGFLCCLRISEVLKLQPKDIDFSRKLLFIEQTKNGKNRYVPIPSPLIQDLKSIPILIPRRTLQFNFQMISERSINKKIHFHTLRHSGATYYLSHGMSILELQRLLGHSETKTTMIYLHVNDRDVQSRMQEIWS